MVLAISKHIFFVIGEGGGQSPEGMVIFNSRSSGWVVIRGVMVFRGGDIRKDTVGKFLLRIWKKNVSSMLSR